VTASYFWKKYLAVCTSYHALWSHHLGYNLDFQLRDKNSTPLSTAVIYGLVRTPEPSPENSAKYVYSELNNDQLTCPDSLFTEIWVTNEAQTKRHGMKQKPWGRERGEWSCQLTETRWIETSIDVGAIKTAPISENIPIYYLIIS
jgi:hypothetical protein